MNDAIRIASLIAVLTAFATLPCPGTSAADLDAEGLLHKLNSLDESLLHGQTILVEMDYPEYGFQLGYKGTSKRRIALTSDDASMAVECEIRHMSEPVYRKGAEPIDYDKDGNYLVWRNTRTCSLLENDLHARRREQMLIRVTPEGKLIEQEGAPVVDFYKPGDLSWTFMDFMLPIWTTGRGFARCLSRIVEVEPDQQSGLISFRANGTLSPKTEGTWQISVDPKAAYLVRSASFTANRKASASFVCTTAGTKWHDTMCLAERATLKMGANIPRFSDNVITSAATEFKPQADVALFKRARSLFRRPLPRDTEVLDFQVTPTARYRVGSLPMTNRELLDVVANAEPVIGDANHAAPAQARVLSDANNEPIDANHPEQDSTSAEPNRDTNPYSILVLAAAIVLIAAIGVFYARKKGKN